MALVKPVKKEVIPDEDRAVYRLRTEMTEFAVERQAKPAIYQILMHKVHQKDPVIDMEAMKNYCFNILSISITEFMLRRIIRNFEFDYTRWSYFKIINADEQFKKEDEIRATQISKRGQSSVQGINTAC